MYDIINVSNQMNTLGFRNVTSKEIDRFFTICSRVREQGTQGVMLSFKKLKELTSYKPTLED
jgi:plasmid replication initiation protein